MTVNLDFYFKNSDDVFILDKYKDAMLSFNGNWWTFRLAYLQVEELTKELIISAEKNNVEFFMTLRSNSESPPTWFFDLTSLIIDDRFFMIYKYRTLSHDKDYNASIKEENYDFIDVRFRRKAKLFKIDTDKNLNPEYLFNNSWFTELNRNNW